MKPKQKTAEKTKNQEVPKSRLHKRSKHVGRYDFKELIKVVPELESFVGPNIKKEDSIDFADPTAVRLLNTAILKHNYDIENWAVPKNYLTPPIPGRADYIHHAADLLGNSNYGNIPKGNKVRVMDIGVGASCIYPIIGTKEYGWEFIGVENDEKAMDSAENIVNNNPGLKESITIRYQNKPKDIFYGVLKKEEQFDLTICNPPFHASAKEAQESTLRKLNNLDKDRDRKSPPTLNFGGQSNELWCEGGERKFILEMIRQSKRFRSNCFWFSTLVSKQTNVKTITEALKNANVEDIVTIPMGQGNKSSRIMAWTFLNTTQQTEWRNKKWGNKYKNKKS